MICEEKFLWKQLGEGMLLRALSPSFLGPLPPRPLGSGQPMVTAAVCYFVGHGAGECIGAEGRQGTGGNFLLPEVASCSRGVLEPLREAAWAPESVGSVPGAEEEGGHRARGRKRLWVMGTEAWPLAI